MGSGIAQVAATAGFSVKLYDTKTEALEKAKADLEKTVGKPVETVPLGGTAMPMAVSPDKRVLYVALRLQPFRVVRVVSLAIDPTSGKLRKLGEAALADSMANIGTDAAGRWLFAAS